MIEFIRTHLEDIIMWPLAAIIVLFIERHIPTRAERRAERNYLAYERARRIHGPKTRRRL